MQRFVISFIFSALYGAGALAEASATTAPSDQSETDLTGIALAEAEVPAVPDSAEIDTTLNGATPQESSQGSSHESEHAAERIISAHTLPLYQDYSEWDLQLDRDGVQIYTSPWPDSDFVAFKSVQTVSADLQTSLAHILEIQGFGKWIHNLESARLIKDFNDQRERSIYMHLSMPWPLQDRDTVIGQRIEQDADSLIVKIVEWSEARSLPELDGLVRIPRLVSEYYLIPVKRGETKLVWQGHNEPGGGVPSFLANWFTESIFYESSMTTRGIVESVAGPSDLVPNLSVDVSWIVEPAP